MGKKLKKIALVIPYAQPETGAPIARINFLHSYLSKKGFRLEVFAPSKSISEGTFNGIKIHRFSGFLDFYGKLSAFGPDLVYSSGPPPHFTWHAILYSKIKRIPVISEARDPWVKSKIRLGLLEKGSLKEFQQRIFEKYSYRLASHTSTISHYLREILLREYHLNPEKISVVEHSVNTELFKTDRKKGEALKKKMGIENEKILVYVGGAWVGISEMVEALSEILAKKKAFLLLVLSREKSEKSSEFKKIDEIIRQKKLGKRVKLLFNLEHGSLPEYLSMASLGLSVVPEGMDYVTSNKLKEYSACGLPFASKCTKKSAHAEIAEKYNVGFTAESWREFSDCIEKALADKKGLEEKSKNARKLALKKYSYSSVGKKLEKTIRSLI